MKRLDDLDDQANQASRGKEFAAFLAFGYGELAKKIFIDSAKRIGIDIVRQGIDGFEQFDQQVVVKLVEVFGSVPAMSEVSASISFISLLRAFHIARCLLRNRRFVILDEPTSALDVESEHAIQQAFDKLFENRTVFIIAHRLSTIRRADRILVIGERKILQDGTYESLSHTDGPFRRLHQLSTGEPEAIPS